MTNTEFVLSIPSIAFLSVFFLIPALTIVFYSFKPTDLYGTLLPGWTLEAYRSLATLYYLKLFVRTMSMSLITTSLCLGLAIPVSYFIMQQHNRMRQLLILSITIPFWSSFIIRVFAWKSILHPEGVLKKLLVSIGYLSPQDTLLYSIPTVIFVMIYAYLPFAILPVYSAASKFDTKLLEAAYDLGASKKHAFFQVFVPGIRQGVTIAFIIVFIMTTGSYVIPDLVGGTSSEMLGNKIVQKTLVDRNLPQACALATVLACTILVPIGAIRLFQNIRMPIGPKES